MELHTALEILGIASNSSLADAKKAYREQVKLWHPDRYSNGSALKTIAAKNIQDANLAYAFLKRCLPAAPASTSPSPTNTSRRFETPSPGPAVLHLFDRTLQVLAMFCKRFPQIPFRPLMAWLQHDAHHHYRPWYRYPATSGPGKPRRGKARFDQALQDAMRHHAAPRGHQRRRPPPPPSDSENKAGPINGLPKLDKTKGGHDVNRTRRGF